jgi:hypothetical protein
MRTLTGTPTIPLTALIADTIAVHGLRWAVAYYTKRLPRDQARVLLVGAYCV